MHYIFETDFEKNNSFVSSVKLVHVFQFYNKKKCFPIFTIFSFFVAKHLSFTNIGCMVHWIRFSTQWLDRWLILQSIGENSCCSLDIRSFHQLFLCTKSLDMGLVMVLYQCFSCNKQLWKNQYEIIIQKTLSLSLVVK